MARLLEELYWLEQNHEPGSHFHEVCSLQAVNRERIDRYLATLAREQWVELSGAGGIRLTPAGRRKTEEVLDEIDGREAL